MNERIKELAERADLYADGYLQSEGEYHPDWHTVRDNKFAELIIKECLDIASKTHETKYGKMSCANDDETVRLIKEHFGVE